MMLLLLAVMLLPLQIRVSESVEGLTLNVVNQAGEVVLRLPVAAAGDYTLDLKDGEYRIVAVVQDTPVLTIPNVSVPSNDPVLVTVNADTVSGARRQQQAGAQRNENIQVNLIDNNAINEQLGREGAQVRPIPDFTAVRAGYAAEFGGLGRNLDILAADRRRDLHGELSWSHQNSVFNARTFFQVGTVKPARRNQFAVSLGGPLTRGLSFAFSAEELRQSGFVNGNVLVPLPGERIPRTTDPELIRIISRYLGAYPQELPNRTEVDPRMLNTNSTQTIRTSGGSFRLDWDRSTTQRLGIRYSLQDTFIDSFEFVAGQNPNQRLRPQNLNLYGEWRRSASSSMRAGVNYMRRKIHILVPPGAVGNNVFMSRQIEDLGPKQQFPILRVRNDFEYLVAGTEDRGRHRLDWGSEIRRYQMNDIQSDELRGAVIFNANFGRTAVENLLLGTPSHYRVTLGNLYRGFRNTDFNLFLNDRVRLTTALQITLGLRYELAGAPSEVQNLTRFPFRSDRNNFAPRFGFSVGAGGNVFRGGAGVAFGRVFPATFQWARFNPPEVLRLYLPTPDLRDPLRQYRLSAGPVARSALNILDPDLSAPYSSQFSLEWERELPLGLRLRSAYVGSRTLKLFQVIYGNRAGRPAGIPVTTATVNDRRPDPRYFGVERLTNMARAYFDAGQLSLEKSAGHGVAFRATYTWSKAIDTGSEFSSTAVNDDEIRSQTPDDQTRDLRAVSRFDSPHSLVVAYSWQLPGQVLRGWVLSGTTLFRSGTPFTVESGTDAPPFGNVDGERQDRPSIVDPSILGISIDHPDTSQSLLRRSAFSTADTFALGRGNLARNTFRRDGISNFNLALQRAFSLDDRARTLTFRAEAINLTNHPQFDQPGFQLASPSFGQITNTLNAGRIVQFNLGLKW